MMVRVPRGMCALLLMLCLLDLSQSQLINVTDRLGSIYVNLLLDKYGSNGFISSSALDSLVARISCDTNTCSLDNITSAECLCLKEGLSSHLGIVGSVSAAQLPDVATAILYAAQNDAVCNNTGEEGGNKHHVKPSASEVWGYSFVCVTLINLCALMGMLFIPLMNKHYYQKILMYMVALAVGTLTGSSLLFLIPEAFGLGDEDSPYRHVYVWKLTIVIGGIYMFFLVERLLAIFLGSNSHVHDHGQTDTEEKYKKYQNGRPRHTSQCSRMSDGEEPMSSLKFHTVSRVEESMNMSFKVPAVISQHAGTGDVMVSSPSESTAGLLHTPMPAVIESNGQTAPTEVPPPGEAKTKIKSVAWMIIFGDGLHNFIDGLSIGAAFTGSILAGVSVSVAVFCEELPHELGDFAILLDAGMSMKQALSYNFLSACMCYLGVAVGILVGELENGSQWIFALAAGMFLYIALCDMLPEVNHAGEDQAKTTGEKWRVLLLQNAGLLTGFAIMLILALYAENIEF